MRERNQDPFVYHFQK